MGCRIDVWNLDIAATAGWYSTIAGLLAGFALLAILLPLDHEANQDQSDNVGHSAVIFACAFFTLLILAFNYASLAGRPSTGLSAGVAAHQHFINGAVFGLAILLLLLGLRAVITTYGANAAVFAPARSVMLGTTALLAPLVALSLQFANASNLEKIRIDHSDPSASCGPGGIPSGIWINLTITALAAAGVIALAVFRNHLPRSLSAATIVAKAVLILAVAVTAWAAIVVPLIDREFVTGAAFEHALLIVTGIATMIVAAAAWIAQ